MLLNILLIVSVWSHAAVLFSDAQEFNVCPDPRDPGCCLQKVTYTDLSGQLVTKPLGYSNSLNQCTWPEGYLEAAEAQNSSDGGVIAQDSGSSNNNNQTTTITTSVSSSTPLPATSETNNSSSTESFSTTSTPLPTSTDTTEEQATQTANVKEEGKQEPVESTTNSTTDTEETTEPSKTTLLTITVSGTVEKVEATGSVKKDEYVLRSFADMNGDQNPLFPSGASFSGKFDYLTWPQLALIALVLLMV